MTCFDDIATPLKETSKWVLRQTAYRNLTIKPKREELPFLVRFDPGNVCNQACIKCFYPQYAAQGAPKTFMSVANFERIAEMVFPYTYYLQLACSFETMTHPQFSELVRITDRYKIGGLGLVTNGSLLSGDKARALAESEYFIAIAVSLDAIKPETYLRMRGRPHLERVLKNLADFDELKRSLGTDTPKIKINTLVSMSNYRELPDILRWCVEHGVAELELSHIAPIERSNEESMLNDVAAYNAIHDELGRMAAGVDMYVYLPPPFDSAYDNFDPESGQYTARLCQDVKRSEFDTSNNDEVDDSLPNPYPEDCFCICPWMTMQIDPWGSVFPCSHRTCVEPVGNLLRQSLGDVVNSMKMLKLRENLIGGKLEGVCANCRAGTPGNDPMKRRAFRVVRRSGD